MNSKLAIHEHSFNAYDDDALGDLDMADLLKKLATKDVTAKELVAASINRAEKANKELNAIVSDSYQLALDEAQEKQNAINQSSNGTASLLGIPTFIKDTDDAAGLATSLGSAGLPRTPARKDSSFVKQVRQTGLINLGKSTTPEFGLTGTTESLYQGPTLNPWNKNFSTGGSSGGACALVASGVVPIAHANDGAGSIRIPASCCGLVGLKPTRGRTAPVDGSGVMPVKILHQGVVTRTVRDTALFYEAVEQRSAPKNLPGIGKVDSPSTKRLRIALLTDEADSECTQAAEQAAALLAGEGHHVDPIKFPFSKQTTDDFFLLWGAMAFGLHRFGSVLIAKGFNRNQTEPFTQSLSSEFSKQILKAPAAFWRLRKFAQEYHQLFTQYDCLLTPTLAHAPPEIGYLSTTEPYEVCIERLRQYIPYTPYQNISGAPAMSMPIAKSQAGVPIGVMFAGAWGEDKMLLELAYEFEALSEWRHLNEQ